MLVQQARDTERHCDRNDVAPDGRFLMMQPAANTPIHLQVVLDWLAEVRQGSSPVQRVRREPP